VTRDHIGALDENFLELEKSKTCFNLLANMGVAKKTRKFAQVKRVIGQRDNRTKEGKARLEALEKERASKRETVAGELIREAPQMPSHMFFQHNEALVPPYKFVCPSIM
jgi:hypothetical protein